tara:strand:- start:452 stop:619 length:168 start_codon:yes stop_codon:yes gene_type:complete
MALGLLTIFRLTQKPVGQPDGRRIGVHAAHQSLVPVGGDQQDSHMELFLGEIIFR